MSVSHGPVYVWGQPEFECAAMNNITVADVGLARQVQRHSVDRASYDIYIPDSVRPSHVVSLLSACIVRNNGQRAARELQRGAREDWTCENVCLSTRQGVQPQLGPYEPGAEGPAFIKLIHAYLKHHM